MFLKQALTFFGDDVSAVDAGARSVVGAAAMVEDGANGLPELIAHLFPNTGRAYTVGLTGSPGVGKSSLAAGLVETARARDKAVAVLAIDPTSPFTGGALLGDRLRMQRHATDPSVFIRSMATRGHLGGLALAAPEAVRVLDALQASGGCYGNVDVRICVDPRSGLDAFREAVAERMAAMPSA